MIITVMDTTHLTAVAVKVRPEKKFKLEWDLHVNQ